MANQYWLFKSEEATYSVRDLASAPSQTTNWDGVRNYQARNFLRDIVKKGDRVLFYHSNAKPPGIAGFCTVVKEGYPDPSAFDSSSEYFDPRSKQDNPTWYSVDVKLDKVLSSIISLDELKSIKGLEEMMVTKRGIRLSIQPVTRQEWVIIERIAGQRMS